jgi:hypothetical protein
VQESPHEHQQTQLFSRIIANVVRAVTFSFTVAVTIAMLNTVAMLTRETGEAQ